MGRNSVTSIAPGFRFHPTDEELVRYYLRRKVSGKAFRFDPIGDIDIYKSEPWDLPSQSKLKSRDLEWYFFSALDKKYGNSSRTNRATEKGYWKTTGKDRPVRHSSRIVGMKKTLVYHSGRAPRGARSNWVMHEYRLADEELANKGIQQDAFVLCRIFQKSGTGPKNGEQYGAPFLEEEWENDEVAPPGEEFGEEDVLFGDGAYVETNDLEQKLDMVIACESNSVPKNFVCGESSSYPEQSQGFEYQRPVVGTDGTFEPQDDQFLNMVDHFQEFIEEQKPNVGMDGAFEPHHAQFFDMPKPDMVSENVKDNYTEASHDENALNFNYALDDLYLDAADVLPIFDGSFLEANDLVNPIETNDLVNPIGADPAGVEMVDDYLSFFDNEDDITQYISFDSPDIMGTENPVPDQTQPFTEQKANEGSEDASMANKHDLEAHCSNEASSSKQKTDDSKLVSGNTFMYTGK
ncbi:hypothetical protein L6164_006894 [Bauhinia variegata]|uniref:Uncharacterized protein n=1 Tax=Bauhinia variegata TaxID=167791 RepID=A0ACB9PYM3_BAUVA|nr:hypothetical protein L6164_006894 [Bauhinia variegata]